MLTEIAHGLRLIAQQDDLLPITLVFLGTAALVAGFSRRQRRHVRTALTMFGLALFLTFLSVVPAALGWPTAALALHTSGLLLVLLC